MRAGLGWGPYGEQGVGLGLIHLVLGRVLCAQVQMSLVTACIIILVAKVRHRYPEESESESLSDSVVSISLHPHRL